MDAILSPSRALRATNFIHPPAPPTPATLTLCLAYFAYCNPLPHRRGRLLRIDDARRLAARLGSQSVVPASPHLDPPVAFHLLWLLTADFLRFDPCGSLRPSPEVAFRLAAPLSDPFAPFLDEAWRDEWAAAATRLGLVDGEATAFLRIARRARQRPVDESPLLPPPARWDAADDREWRFRLLPGGHPGLLFDLLALGRFEPPDLLRVSPLTLAAPHARDLGYDRLCWLIETASAAALDDPRRATLRDWLGRGRVCRLRGPLLRVARPGLLGDLYATRRLRPYLLEQISPRCALFDRAGLPALRRRLAALGYPLHAEPPIEETTAALPDRVAPPDRAAQWLGLRVLAGLQRYLPLPGPSPAAALDTLAAALPFDDMAVLDAHADRLLADLHAVIQGRDAFFPARRPPPAELVARLRAAIADEQTVTVDYCPPDAAEAKRHTVEPLRLEAHDSLIYLIAYSYRAESTLTFRLDRVRAVVSG